MPDCFNESENRQTLFSYEDSNNPYFVTTRIDDNGAITNYTYKANGDLRSVEDTLQNVTTYYYTDDLDPSPLNPNHEHLVRKVQRADVTVNGVLVTYDPTEFQYDSQGNLEKIIDATGAITEMTYAADGLVTSVKDRRGNTVEMVHEGVAFDSSRRRLLQMKVPKGLVSADGYRTITLGYNDPDNLDNVTSVTDDLGHVVLTEYDAKDRVIQVTDARGKISQFHFIDGLLDEMVLPPNNGSSGLNRSTSMAYDPRGRMTELKRDIDAGNQQTIVKYLYNLFSEVTALIRVKDAVDKTFSYTYDALGRPVSSVDSLGQTHQTLYETACPGNSQTTPRGLRRKFGVDNLCRLSLLEVGDPDPYDDRELSQIRESREFTYDELGRLVRSVQTRDNQYGKAILGVDSSGPIEERTYFYDELDRLLEVTYENGQTVSWEYDPEGNVTKMTDPEGKVSRYEYYRDNLLHKVILERTGESDRVFTYSYDPAGRLDKIVYPASTDIEAVFRDEANLGPAGIGTGFDPNGNLRFLRYQKTNGTLIRRFEWTYDDSNNRESMLDVSPTKAVKWEYKVDWLDRLVSVKRAEAINVANLPASPLGATYLQREYVFDESDNRTFFDDHVAGMSYQYLYKSIDDNGITRYSDQLEEIRVSSTVGERNPANFTSLEMLEHDADGNMTHRIKAGVDTEYKWDDFDRLKRVESTENAETTRLQDNRYGVDGIRKRKLDKNGNSSTEYTAGITTSVSKGGSGTSAAPTISYVMGHMLLGAEIDGNFVFHLMDAQGSVRDVVDDSGAVIRSMEFQEHGLGISSSESGTFSPKTYQGGLSVNDDTNDSGLYLMGHRHFAADLGRFISRDPIGFRGGLNLYNGHGVNPVSMVDPWGLSPNLGDIGSDSAVQKCRAQTMDKRKEFEGLKLQALHLLDRLVNGPRKDLKYIRNALNEVEISLDSPIFGIATDARADTSKFTNNISINPDYLGDPVLLARDLLHEAVHVRQGRLWKLALQADPEYDPKVGAYNIVDDEVLLWLEAIADAERKDKLEKYKNGTCNP